MNFLDVENCKALLPSFVTHQCLKLVDNELTALNKSGTTRHVFSMMIARNKATIGKDSDARLYTKLPGALILYPWNPQKTFTQEDIERPDYDPDPMVKAMFRDPKESPSKMPFIQATKLNVQFGSRNRTIHLRVPIQMLMKGWGDANEGHQGYSHTIVNFSSKDENKSYQGRATTQVEDGTGKQPRTMHHGPNAMYHGITGRNWLLRFSEHLREIKEGSHKLFHSAVREAWEDYDGKGLLLLNSQLLRVNMSYDEAMHWEEDMVQHSLSPKGLNMIPGGYEGMKYLHTMRITDTPVISLEEREAAEAELVRQHPRLGVPNPKVAELWRDDGYYTRAICARNNTLNPDQVFNIRHLSALGMEPEKIFSQVGARNVLQVKRVLKGETYARIQ